MNFTKTQTKTTCEIYREAISLELIPSVRSALYLYLHFQEFFKSTYRLDKCSSKFKKALKGVYGFAQYCYQNQLEYKHDIDVLFFYVNDNKNYLGIQRILAESCHKLGLKTGILCNPTFQVYPEFDTKYSLTGSCFIPQKNQQEIVSQCVAIGNQLYSANQNEFDAESAFVIASIATKIEIQAIQIQRFLEINKPKLVILTNAKDLNDSAAQIACSRTNTLSILIPHGFPQSSQFPLDASYVMSYSPHHDFYLRSLCISHDHLKPLGWLEPIARMPFYSESLIHANSVDSVNGPFRILFFSQLSGWKPHRCNALVEQIPKIIKALDKIPEVESITLRLRLIEFNDVVIKTLLNECGSPKLHLSSDPEILNDLSSSNLLMAFSSTGLLYGPYLGKKSIEIRNSEINSVWTESVLSSQQVYQMEQEPDPYELRDLIMKPQPFVKDKFFYNWGAEPQSFLKLIVHLLDLPV